MGFFNNICGCCKNGDDVAEEDEDGEYYPSTFFFDLQTLQLATNSFSEFNQLGHGGFGPVYKGILANGQEVAVKKLSLNSRQGVREFTNEVKLLLKIQHKNLVTLFGCCVEGPEKMLVYEFLPNKSLDYFLFDKKKSSALDFIKRLHIITGIARGLLYLHGESPVRIIHRDIKASNILLDKDLNPKISDFGLARLFPGEDTHLNTFRVAGTHGYMAPEYAIRGYLSEKTDVFSFGILVLEIVCGRKNWEEKVDSEEADLLNYAWRQYQEQKTVQLVGSYINDHDLPKAAMCIQLGLLCCQANVADRPDMNTVYLMLCSDSFTLPIPKKPALQGRMLSKDTSSTSVTDNTTGISTQTAVSKASSSSSFVAEYSRNSISYTSMYDGR